MRINKQVQKSAGKKLAQDCCLNHIHQGHLVARKHVTEFLALCCFSELLKQLSSVVPSHQRPVLIAICSRCLLLLSGLPLVTIVSSKDKIQEGGNLTFECHVTGSPTPSVRWQTDELKSPFFTQVVKNAQCMYKLYRY